MNKETIIKVLNELNNNTISQLGINVIVEYCTEHNKPVDMIMQYIQLQQMIPNGLYNCLLDALDYYRNKFEIIESKDKQGKTIKFY